MNKNRVMIVDDDVRIGRIFKRVAAKLNVDAWITHNPDEFEADYSKYQPNIIFMDLQMPRLDGVELLRKLAQHKSQAAIFIMSGMDKSILATAQELGKTLKLNMAENLSKPIAVEQLEKVLMRNVSLSQRSDIKPVKLTGIDLKKAIERSELVVHYQPQICFKTGKICGSEALVRWQHPKHGMIYPGDFIPIAERQKDLIGPLTYFVINAALKDKNSLDRSGIELNLSINLSATLLSDLTLPDRMEELLEVHKFDPRRLVLEVTESGAMEDPSLTMDILTRLRLKNIRLSLDDFGTGFSSLVQLYRMPFNEIKIDRSFVMRAGFDKEAAEIARVTIDLGHSLGLKVVAEGVENEETYQLLRSFGCDVCQGFLVGKPVSGNKFYSLVNESSEEPARGNVSSNWTSVATRH